MVQDNVSDTIASQCIITPRDIRHTSAEPHKAYDDVMGVNQERLAGNTDTVARSCLPCNGHIRCFDNNRFLQFDYPSYIENDNTRTASFTSFA